MDADAQMACESLLNLCTSRESEVAPAAADEAKEAPVETAIESPTSWAVAERIVLEAWSRENHLPRQYALLWAGKSGSFDAEFARGYLVIVLALVGDSVVVSFVRDIQQERLTRVSRQGYPSARCHFLPRKYPVHKLKWKLDQDQHLYVTSSQLSRGMTYLPRPAPFPSKLPGLPRNATTCTVRALAPGDGGRTLVVPGDLGLLHVDSQGLDCNAFFFAFLVRLDEVQRGDGDKMLVKCDFLGRIEAAGEDTFYPFDEEYAAHRFQPLLLPTDAQKFPWALSDRVFEMSDGSLAFLYCFKTT